MLLGELTAKMRFSTILYKKVYGRQEVSIMILIMALSSSMHRRMIHVYIVQ